MACPPDDVDSPSTKGSVSVINTIRGDVDAAVRNAERIVESVGDLVYEFVFVDRNPSIASERTLGAACGTPFQLIHVGPERSPGEARNIGVEAAVGDFILLLDDHMIVESDCIRQLSDTLIRHAEYGAVGPMILDSSGAVQEIGGYVLENGDIVRIGCGPPSSHDHVTSKFGVDYCSASCLLLKRDDFLRLGGFSFEWDPGGYEDIDLCLRVRNEVGPVMANPLARVVRGKPEDECLSGLQLETNRLLFVTKWGNHIKSLRGLAPTGPNLSGRSTDRDESTPPAPLEDVPTATSVRPGDGAVLYTPYELVPGGGERFLLELASTLSQHLGNRNVRMAFPHPYSNLRLRQVSEALGTSGLVRPTTLDSVENDSSDIMVVLGNHIVPPIAGRARRRNIYICQFPFEATAEEIRSKAPYLATFDEIWVYSEFVRRYVNGYLRLLDLPARATRVMYPPATLSLPGALPSWRDRKLVLTVGRFFQGGHDKRQDVVIDILKQLSQRFDKSIPLALVGSLHATASSRARFSELVAMAKGCDCRFYPNGSRQDLMDLYMQGGILIHAAGYGVDKFAHPESLEHFGIAPVEAASVGCIPLVYDEGGPAEVMDLLDCPTTFQSIPEAVEQLARLVADPEGSTALSQDLIVKAQAFSAESFRARVSEALSGVL